jgi:hypothetical protein
MKEEIVPEAVNGVAPAITLIRPPNSGPALVLSKGTNEVGRNSKASATAVKPAFPPAHSVGVTAWKEIALPELYLPKWIGPFDKAIGARNLPVNGST